MATSTQMYCSWGTAARTAEIFSKSASPVPVLTATLWKAHIQSGSVASRNTYEVGEIKVNVEKEGTFKHSGCLAANSAQSSAE